jgi:hypothetical protein
MLAGGFGLAADGYYLWSRPRWPLGTALRLLPVDASDQRFIDHGVVTAVPILSPRISSADSAIPAAGMGVTSLVSTLAAPVGARSCLRRRTGSNTSCPARGRPRLSARSFPNYRRRSPPAYLAVQEKTPGAVTPEAGINRNPLCLQLDRV